MYVVNMSRDESGSACARATEQDVVVSGRVYPMALQLVATEDTIQKSIKAAAERIAHDYRSLMHRDSRPDATGDGEAVISLDNPLILISVLKGSYIFTADFVRYLGDCGLPHVTDFIRIASYNNGTSSTGNVSVLAQPRFANLRGKHVLIVEDICDSGRSLRFLHSFLQEKYQPKTLKTLVFANKPASARRTAFRPDYKCIDVPDKYVVGYGFEVNDRYRDLRHVFVLKDNYANRYPAKL